MVTQLFSIKDDLADEFGPIFSAKNLEVARRKVAKLVLEQPDCIGMTLHHLGSFDDSTGLLKSADKSGAVYLNVIQGAKNETQV
ncbi:MAG: nonstructural protein [Arizlama microvirus]|nr:MAG: nonstructural protein [Arizlama microvirus]